MERERIYIKVVPRARKEHIVERDGVLRVYVTVPPVDNKANERVVKLLGDYLDIPMRCIRIIKGFNSRNKVVELERGKE